MHIDTEWRNQVGLTRSGGRTPGICFAKSEETVGDGVIFLSLSKKLDRCTLMAGD